MSLFAEAIDVRVALLVCAIALASGCASQSDDEALSLAQDAYSEAKTANSALDAGTNSGTTLGNEVADLSASQDEARQYAAQLRIDILNLETRVQSLEGRLQAICDRAPAACD